MDDAQKKLAALGWIHRGGDESGLLALIGRLRKIAQAQRRSEGDFVTGVVITADPESIALLPLAPVSDADILDSLANALVTKELAAVLSPSGLSDTQLTLGWRGRGKPINPVEEAYRKQIIKQAKNPGGGR